MGLSSFRPGRIKRSKVDAIVVLVPPGGSRLLLNAEDLVGADDDPAAIFEFHDHLLGEDFQGQYPALSTRGDDPRADGRQLALEGLVGVELVTQAAFQPTTTSRYFRGVKCRFLDLGHPHR